MDGAAGRNQAQFSCTSFASDSFDNADGPSFAPGWGIPPPAGAQLEAHAEAMTSSSGAGSKGLSWLAAGAARGGADGRGKGNPGCLDAHADDCFVDPQSGVPVGPFTGWVPRAAEGGIDFRRSAWQQQPVDGAQGSYTGAQHGGSRSSSGFGPLAVSAGADAAALGTLRGDERWAMRWGMTDEVWGSQGYNSWGAQGATPSFPSASVFEEHKDQLPMKVNLAAADGNANANNGGQQNRGPAQRAQQSGSECVGPGPPPWASQAPPGQERGPPPSLQGSAPAGMDGTDRGGGRGDWSTARWHKSADAVGVLSEDDHLFTKSAGPRLKRTHISGTGYELATICMVFDASLRCGGTHAYRFCFVDGELGPADGAGFVFDTKVRRRPLGQMRAVFLNQRGFVCLRRGQHVSKLPVQLPRLALGMYLTLSVNLDRFVARFNISDAAGSIKGSADVGLEALFEGEAGNVGGIQLRSGFFCAVVTGNITVGLY
mmetsp:Transcript_64774/g.186154  ORF Transcript_64774/g.186154 Transcript_64774/m.186154 type:complete len:486 (-) Transcript_64774:111-1568(-)